MSPYSWYFGADPHCIGPASSLPLEAACSAPWAHKVFPPPLLQILPSIPAEAPPPLPKSHQKTVAECTVALPQFHQLYLHKNVVILRPSTVIFVPVFQLQHKPQFLISDFLGHTLIYCANVFGNFLWSPQIPMLLSTTACWICSCGYIKLQFQLLHFLCNWFLRPAPCPA